MPQQRSYKPITSSMKSTTLFINNPNKKMPSLGKLWKSVDKLRKKHNKRSFIELVLTTFFNSSLSSPPLSKSQEIRKILLSICLRILSFSVLTVFNSYLTLKRKDTTQTAKMSLLWKIDKLRSSTVLQIASYTQWLNFRSTPRLNQRKSKRCTRVFNVDISKW